MYKIFILSFIFLFQSSCTFLVDISEDTVKSSHVPNFSDTTQTVAQKLKGTVWRQIETDPNRDIFLFIHKSEFKYFTMAVIPNTQPIRVPDDFEYISLLQVGGIPDEELHQRAIYQENGTQNYIGIRLMSDRVLQVAFITGEETTAVAQIKNTLENESGQMFDLYI